MAELNTIARPYAHATFELALEQKQLDIWQYWLEQLSECVAQNSVKTLLAHPSVSSYELGETLLDLAAKNSGKDVDAKVKNFVRLLAANRRLSALAVITELFKEYRAQHEKIMAVDVYSTEALDEAQQQKLITALSKRLDCQVELKRHIDKSLIGGILIKAGDMVIDGSIKGKLSRLMNTITGRELCN